MNKSTIVFLINDNVRAVRAKYEAGETAPTEIFKTFDPDIAVGDLAVVESTTRHEMTVVKVTEVDIDLDLDIQTPVRWIVQRIDQTAHKATLAQEEEAIAAVNSAEKRRKREALRASIFADQTDQIARLSLAKHAGDDGLTE